MKDTIATIVTIVMCFCCLLYLAFLFGEKSKQDEIEKRAFKMDCCDECIELVIFNESQL